MPTIIRVYTGDDGRSHLEEVTLALQPFVDTEGAYGEGTPLQQAMGITFRVAPPGYVLNWHCAPRRQYTITLSGEAEIEVGDGTVKRIGVGDVILAEDLTGQGHITRVVGNQPRLSVVVPLAETES
jgi:quercetin dioxygenase-like cupin family protein